MANNPPRVDSAETHLLLAELKFLRDKLGQDRTERLLGRKYDVAFIAECIDARDVPASLAKRGYRYDCTVVPTAELERALEVLWDAMPEEEFWRARA